VTERNAQYDLAKPDSLSNRVATRMRTRMFAAFMQEIGPGSSLRLPGARFAAKHRKSVRTRVGDSPRPGNLRCRISG